MMQLETAVPTDYLFSLVGAVLDNKSEPMLIMEYMVMRSIVILAAV
jgi:hypothetical protein